MQTQGADELFEDYLRRRQAGEPVDFEELCAAHPAAEEELRAHKRRFDDFGDLLGGDSSARLVPGALVAEKYELERLLGKGGFGQVWLATQQPSGQQVALKLVRYDELDLEYAEDIRRRFSSEAVAMGRARHAGIVAMLDSGRDGELGWIALEYMEGGDLHAQLVTAREEQDAGRLPTEYDRSVAELVAKVCDALQVVHDAGIVHRDLKPHNILMDRDNQPKVADFGLARVADLSLSRSGTLVGTYYYMSPEQVLTARVAPLDHRSDIFSLGVVLYEMLAFAKPFGGDTTHQVADQIVNRDPPDPRTLRSRAPLELCLIAGKALEKEPERRYQSMAEFAADLRRHLAHEPITAHAPSVARRVAKWCRRHPVAASVASLVTTSLVVISVLAIQLHFAERELSLALDVSEARRLSIAADHAKARVETLEQEARQLGGTSSNSIPAMEAWVDEARRLFEGDARRGGDGLEGLAERLVRLRGQADHVEAVDRSTDVDLDEAMWLRDLLAEEPAWLRRIAGREPWPDREAEGLRVAARAGLSEKDRDDAEQVLALATDPDHLGAVQPPERDWGDEHTLAMLRKGSELGLLDLVVRGESARAHETPEPWPDSDLMRARWWLLAACGRFEVATRQAEEDLRALESEVEAMRAPEERPDWASILAGLRRERDAVRTACLRLAEVAREPEEAIALAERDLRLLDLRIAALGTQARFADLRLQDLHDRLRAAVASLAHFGCTAGGQPFGLGPDLEGKLSVPARLSRARALRDLLAAEPAQAAWAAALQAVQDSPRYENSRWPTGGLAPQEDLLPLGADPDSGFLEFAHLPSGEPPRRAADGRIEPRAEHAIVLVLLPGGRIVQRIDARTKKAIVFGKDFPRADEVELFEHDVPPFFCAKHELTEAQWSRLADSATLDEARHAWRSRGLRPAAGIDWHAATRVLASAGLALPSAVQWDHAAFGFEVVGEPARRDVRHWPIDVASAEAGLSCNIADRSYKVGNNYEGEVSAWDDGHVHAAPIGALRANPFGVHELYGNVWEWCSERVAGGECWAKGGSYATSREQLCWGEANYTLPLTQEPTLGLRAVRALR